jgi:hypothetical protein
MTPQSTQPFILQPFALEETLRELKVAGSIQRQNNALILHYELSDPLALVEFDPPEDLPEHPARKHNLWETTCFEFFLGSQQQPDCDRYWEFNLSPAGHWNAYRFEGYRQGMQDELAWRELPFKVQQFPKAVTLDLTLDLTPIVSTDRKIEVAIAAVIALKTGSTSYWALTHCAPQTDFHQRESFTIKL